MKTKTKRFGKELLHTIMLLMLAGWTNVVWAGSEPIVAVWDFTGTHYEQKTVSGGNIEELDPSEMDPADVTAIRLPIDTKTVTQYPSVYEEKCLYSTDFQDWKDVNVSTTEKEVNSDINGQTIQTVDGQNLSFYLQQTIIDNDKEETNRNWDYQSGLVTKGYMRAAKKENAYARTSILNNVTKVVFVQTSTSTPTGWGLKVIDKDGNEEIISNKGIEKKTGEKITIEVNRNNIQLVFYNLGGTTNYSFMTSLEIYGNVEVKEDVTITYYDTDGTTELGKETVSASEPLTFMDGIEDKVTVPSGQKFRGWFDGTGVNAEKVLEGTELSVDLNLFATATPIEEATDGSYYEYNMTKKNFYQEDHELIEIDGGVWHDNKHGWSFSKGGTIRVQVAGKAHIDMTLCNQGKSGTISVTDENGETISSFDAKAATDATVQGIDYTGGTPTTLNINVPAGAYIHGFNLFNFVPVYLTFDCSDKNIQGTGPAVILCEALTGKATMPDHTFLYRKGWTFKGWTDGTNTYKAGEEYIFTKSVTLKPKMEANTIDLTDTYKQIKVVWPFDHRKAPAISMNQVAVIKPYTKTVKVEGEEYDVTLLMDATLGKIENTDSEINALSNGAEGAQINNKTQFTIPAVYGMTVTIHASNKIDNRNNKTETFFGKDPANDAIIQVSDANGYSLKNGTDNEDILISEDYKTITFKYKGDAKEATIFIEKSGTNDRWGFYNDITVTYPVLPSVDIMYLISNMDSDKYPNERPINAGKATVALKDTGASRDNIGIRYKEGDVVNISVKPDYGYDFDKLTINGTTYQSDNFDYTVAAEKNIVVVSFKRKELHKVTVKPSDITLGTVSLSPKYDNFYQETRNEEGKLTQVESWFVEGTEVTASASAVRNYMLNYWAEDGNNVSSTNPYTFKTGAADKMLTAHFTLGNRGTVIFKIPEGTVNAASDNYKGSYSITPDAQRNVRSFAIPTNYTFYKNNNETGYGSTLQYWIKEGSDGKDHYELGQLYSFKTPDETITLVPVFKDNPASYTNRLSNAVLRFDFARDIQDYNDPIRNEHHTVCAQEVNIGNNEKPFWTAQAHIEVIEGGEDKSHDRDVTLWCDTGKKGYIRNTDLDTWCAFGPGTILWVPAGTGTKISMLTYAKITTTTFDGVVPTLDEERTKQERKKWNTEKMYVYTYTTTSSADRVAIKIGDDYSYYQWLEINIQPANLVSLHTSVDNDERGTVSKIESTSGTEVKELEDGGHAFHQGDRIRLTINRKFGYQFDKIVDTAKTDKNGNPLAILEMNDDGTVNMVGLNDVSTTTKVERNADGTWGDLNNTVFVLKEIAPTKEELADSLRTRYEVEFNITSHRNFEVHFKAKDTYYITYNAGNFATGTPPEVVWLEAGDKYTIPRNQTLYYEGNTLKYWYDENGNTFDIGSTYTAEAKDVRMFPKFEPNDFNILEITSNATATWYFAKDDGAPTIAYQKTKGILVTQLENDGKSIDMKIDLDATNGKFNNVDGGRPERIQINSGSVIEFTATPGCEALLQTVDNKDNTIEIEGKQLEVTNNQAKTVCTADNSNLKVNFITGPYSRYFSVTYKPQSTTMSTINTLTCGETTFTADEIKKQINTDGHVTFTVSPWEDPDETIPSVTGTATEDGTVSATKATVLTKACVATVKTKSGITVETYPIEFIFATPTDFPKFVKAEVNGAEYTSLSSEIYDVPQSGMVKIVFNRMMNPTTISDDRTEYNAKTGKELIFKYWDQPLGSTLKYEIKPGDGKFVDIYGKECQETLTLILHITEKVDNYKHGKFDFVVGIDGTIDEAVAAANANTKDDGERYYIFVPDGEYGLSGNSTITCATEGESVPKDENGKPRPEMNGKNNGLTEIRKPNVSIVGQSKDGTIIYNHPTVEGISYTATLRTSSAATDFYAEDLTLENRFDYFGSMSGQSSGGAGRAAAFQDKGNRSIMKNVALKSYQDTYYSNNVNENYRGYFENSDIYGVVDWLCGDGNILFEKCNIIIRDRTGNNIAAPSTDVNQEWGYVLNNCNIMSEVENPTQLKGNDWTLARPWGSSDDKIPASPACTFLNTKMYILPRNYGWNKMGEDLVLRFHEYNSMNEVGNLLSLNTRSLSACSPAPGSDDCVLSDDLAKKYTMRNIMGGPDAFEPNELCKQIDAMSGAEDDQDENHEAWDDQIELDDDNLMWQNQPSALCYFIFKLDENTNKWVYKENTTESSANITGYGSGYYCVRAANQMGGLGAATGMIHFELQDPYELEIKQTGDLTVDGVPYGWSTICLPFNAKVPQDVTVYAATAHDKLTEDDKVTDLTMTLTPVKVIDSKKGYVVYGPAGIHPFNPTSLSCSNKTILTGNPTEQIISATNINCYILANKTWGLGFYKFTGSTLKPFKAWLPQDMVSTNNQSVLATGSKAIKFVIAENTSIPSYPEPDENIDDDDGNNDNIKEKIYTISGQRVESANQQGIYISRRKIKFAKH